MVATKKLNWAEHSELESALFQWFSQKCALGIPINGPPIKG
jgi:hypothetical protein